MGRTELQSRGLTRKTLPPNLNMSFNSFALLTNLSDEQGLNELWNCDGARSNGTIPDRLSAAGTVEGDARTLEEKTHTTRRRRPPWMSEVVVTRGSRARGKHRVSARVQSKFPRWKAPAPTVIIRDASATRAAVQVLQKCCWIAVDCEGVLLSRRGALCLLQIASEDSVFMFDVMHGKESLFDAGLRRLLESDRIYKVMHDCRHDCDALFHQYRVLVAPVIDTQVAFSVLRDVRQLKVGLPVSLKTLLRKYVGVSEDNLNVKDEIKTSMRENPNFWLQRPLSCDALQYARFDVVYLLHIARILYLYITNADKNGWDRVLKQSENYAALFRDDEDGPRKAEIQWARMVTLANAEVASRDRSRQAAALREADPLTTFAFAREKVVEAVGSLLSDSIREN